MLLNVTTFTMPLICWSHIKKYLWSQNGSLTLDREHLAIIILMCNKQDSSTLSILNLHLVSWGVVHLVVRQGKLPVKIS